MKSLKVLFVVKSKVMENLGVMYLSSVVKAAGHECRIVDIQHAVSIYNTNWKPDIIGYSIMTGDQDLFQKTNERMLSWTPAGKRAPKTIVGGPHPTFFPDDCQWADVIIPGEAEGAMAALLQSDKFYPSIDSFPWPDRIDFPGMKIRDFITTRGCPRNCSYCYNDKWTKMFPELARVRTRSVGDVVQEIIVARPEFVYFQDSCFALNMKWLAEFSCQYKKFVHRPFHCHLRPEQVTEKRAWLLSNAGCVSVRMALESASQRLRTLINRGNMELDVVKKASTTLKRWGIKFMIQNIIGLPTATIEEDLATLEFNIRCYPNYGWVSIFSPYPGTELGDWCKESGWYKGNYSDISDSFFDTSNLEFDEEHKEQLECLQKIFAVCVDTGYMPKKEELTHDNFEALVHKAHRHKGDKVLYVGVI
ncbi:MAG: B12-binding domain-containing radical SAM protein [Methanothrix sp.]|jgi:radical SAM superfamily enzyme YgiQ (UPF0313 family)|nr:B12-binding domain-containing radical SAM protein [Methanothrix sp.]